jgi:hypothetical protein
MKHTLLVMIVLVLAATPASCQLYEWLDDSGSVHFTDDPDRIPARYRKRVTTRDETLKAEPQQGAVKKESTIRQQPAPPVAPQRYGGRELAWWQASYASRASRLATLKTELAKLKEEQLVARRKKVTLSRLMDRKALADKTAEVEAKETEIKAVEKDLADFREFAENSGLTADMLESGSR